MVETRVRQPFNFALFFGSVFLCPIAVFASFFFLLFEFSYPDRRAKCRMRVRRAPYEYMCIRCTEYYLLYLLSVSRLLREKPMTSARFVANCWPLITSSPIESPRSRAVKSQNIVLDFVSAGLH